MRCNWYAAVMLAASLIAGCGGGGGSASSSPGNLPSSETPPPAPAPGPGPAPPPDPPPTILPPSVADAARLLEQSSFGVTEAGIAQVQSLGLAGYIDQQMATPATGYAGYPYIDYNTERGCPDRSGTCYRDNYTMFLLQNHFFRNALTGNDQLRQRVAFALSQLFVISGNDVKYVYGMAKYQQLLLDNAFGNYRQLLQQVTLSPAMGRFLDMASNDKPNPARGTEPNENYAREVLQLFSIGLVQLNPDGSPRLDAGGKPIPTYDQEVIEGYAHAFTGWTYQTLPAANAKWPNPENYSDSMMAVAAHHDTGAKTLLNGLVLPAGQSQDKDLADALDSIANHPNVGPFIGKRLIQHLVTSNPSPAYVARISAVFADDGAGQRGNLGAVVRAILLDPEARGDSKSEPGYGKLREPALLITAAVRAVGGSSDGVYFNNRSETMLESIYEAPSVFNFYSPDYPIQGTELVGPTFGIFDASTAFYRINFVNTLLIGPVSPDSSVPGATGTQFNLAPWQAIAGDTNALLDRINRLMFHGALSASTRNTIYAAVNGIPVSDTTSRARAALFLAMSSVQFQVEQ